MDKKRIFKIAGAIVAAGVLITLLLVSTASATESPMVDEIISPIDAGKYTLTGTAEPGAKIVVTGGPYELSPIYADESTGYWEKTVTLTQESDNNFSITAQGTDEQTSDAVSVLIVESEAQAQQYEEETGEDRTAPEPPEVDEPESPVDADTATLTGTTEGHIAVLVSGADIVQTESNSSGEFSVEVELDQNATNNFYVAALDDANNISSSTKVVIEEVGPEEETDDDDDDDVVGDDDDDDDDAIEISFPDTEGHWAETYILDLATDEVIGGYEDGTFGPDNNITRAEITKIAMGAFGYDIYEADAAFSDVADDAWYATYVNSAAEQEIISGYSDGTFDPNRYVNRAEALKVIFAASAVADMTGAHIFIGTEDEWENPFPDVTDSDWYYEYLMQAYTAEILSGYADGTFGPANNITRAEVCKIVKNLLELKQEIVATPTI